MYIQQQLLCWTSCDVACKQHTKTGASQIPIYGEAGMYFIPTWLHAFGSVFYSHCVVTIL